MIDISIEVVGMDGWMDRWMAVDRPREKHVRENKELEGTSRFIKATDAITYDQRTQRRERAGKASWKQPVDNE